jgi:hypothetical protein
MALVITRRTVYCPLTPAPDGVTQIFWTSVEYISGTVSVWRNGVRLVASWDTGYEELGNRQVRFREAPLIGDSLTAKFERKP